MDTRTTVIALFSLFSLLLRSAEGQSAIEQVLGILRDPKGYDKQIAPVGQNGTLTVKVQIYVRSIDIDDVHMLGTVDMTLRLMWTDHRIYFNDPRRSFVTLTNTQQAWLPDPFFRGSRKTEQQKTVHDDSYLRIFPDGTLLYSTRLIVTLAFPMDLQRFPHDSQVFSIKIASYGYLDNEVMFEWHQNPVAVTGNVYISSYALEEYATALCRSVTSTGVYSCVELRMLFYRLFGTYLTKWYIPIVCLVIITFFSELISDTNLFGRIFLVLIPILIFCTNNFIFSLTLAPVNYVKAMDIFGGISMTVMFVMLVRVVISFYLATRKDTGKDSDEELPKVTERPTNWLKRVWKWVYARSTIVFRVVVFGFYIAFVFMYFAAYCGSENKSLE